MLTLPTLTKEYVRLLLTELRYRDLVIKPLEEANRKHGDWNRINYQDDPRQFFQTYEILPFDAAERAWSIDDYAKKKLLPLVKAHALKLIRPFPIQFSRMELPLGCRETAWECFAGVGVRGVTDYFIQEDLFLTRFDTLLCWEDYDAPLFADGPAFKFRKEL